MFVPRWSSKFPVARKLAIVDTVTTSLPNFKDLSPVTTYLEYSMKSLGLGHFNATFIGSMFKLDLDVLSVKMNFTDYTYYDAWTACVGSALNAIYAFLENVHMAEADVVLPDSVDVVYTYELQKRNGAKLFQTELRQMIENMLQNDRLKQKCATLRSVWRPISLTVCFGYVDLTATLFTFPCNETEHTTSVFCRE